MVRIDRKADYNRAVITLVFGIFVALWVMVNAGQFVSASFMYLVIGVICIFLYWAWDKFGGWS